jgi:hypothetical protein
MVLSCIKHWFLGASCVVFVTGHSVLGDETKSAGTIAGTASPQKPYLSPKISGSGHRIRVGLGEAALPVAVVRGTPYEMGYHLGRSFIKEIQQFVPPAVSAIAKQMELDTATLAEVWARTAAYSDDRLEQEMLGLADGSGVDITTLQAMHAIPLLMPYSCSSIAAWGKATVDGHLYQTRNLDWSMEVGAHEFPMVAVYIPNEGVPHVVPSFAGMVGAHTGMNLRGIALSEMGDASAKEAPYQVHAAHFTSFFRTMLYDSQSLSGALKIFNAQQHTKKYHFVFGDGMNEKRAVKIRAHMEGSSSEKFKVWNDNDPSDEFSPNVLSCIVYNDEGRGAFPTLQKSHGKITSASLIELAKQIPIKGGNVENVVYDATAMQLWVSYAKGKQEAYQRPYTHIDLMTLDADNDGKPDLKSMQ